jgi:hypothetical protein
MVSGVCPKCHEEIQVEQRNSTFFCSLCGDKAAVSHATALYDFTHAEKKWDWDADPLPDKEASDGENVPFEDSAETIWQAVLSKTNNLEPTAIRHLADYAYDEAYNLFCSGIPGINPEWQGSYWDAFEASCRMTVEAVSPRVFLELKIYQWYPRSNTFLYPISRSFDIQPILDKELWVDWNNLSEALPEGRRESFKELCDNTCRRIRDYFNSGFSAMDQIQNGELSKIMGTWRLKLSTGESKNEVLSFTQNPEGVPHLEAFCTTSNSYDYYRYVKVNRNNQISADEYRHFPSVSGLGGDFYTALSVPLISVMAVYENIMVMPTAIYSRIEPHKIPGYDKAQVFIEKCRAMPCFLRSDSLKSYQMRPIAENHDTVDATKRMRACYIATAVYGDADAPQVERLRRFRDEKLNTNRLGRHICAFYYKVSPSLAGKMNPAGLVSRGVRRTLNWFVKRLGD